MSGDLVELTRGGRLAHVLSRLARSAFTGLVYVEHDEDSLVISMREGRPVFVEDLGDEPSIPDMLLEQGLVTKEQYAGIATRVLESLADNEDIAFCQTAVATRVLSQHQVDTALEARVRGRLIRAIGWEQCRIELDEDPEGVANAPNYAQDVGALIYMGVRTFFDDERVRETIGIDGVVHARLLRPIAEVIEFFQLEPGEAGLLAHVNPDAELGATIDSKAEDVLDAWQLVCMLVLAEMLELSSTPFATPVEPSGVRSTKAMEANAPRREPPPRSTSQGRMPAAREEQPAGPPRMPTAPGDPARAGSQMRIPAARPDASSGPLRGRAPVPREDPDDRPGSERRIPAVREERLGPAPRARAPLPREEQAGPGSRPRMPAARDDSAQARTSPGEERANAARARMPAVSGAPGSAPNEASERQAARPPAERGAQQAERAPARAAAPQMPAERGAKSAPVAAQPAPSAVGVERPRKRPARKLSTALQRLDRELKQARPRNNTPDAPAAPSAAQQSAQSRAHVEQLLRMRVSAQVQKQTAKSDTVKAPDEFKLAQEALRDQQFGRAHEHLRRACEAEPNNEIYAMYCMWAGFRANSLPPDDINKLRTALRNRVSDDEYKGFAYYALGHLSLAEKKDESAEKFFRKAIELDKNNKDAERHLRIIELRRKTAASEQRAGKIFGIEIGIKKP